jgi:hypothetical protein
MTALLGLAVLLALLLSVLPWGPGTHLEFAHRVLRRRKERLPADVADLLGDHREAFQYGNIAADIINFKAVGGHYNHCHRWTIIEEMRSHAETDAERAFILGYLAHLAADTIAHNHFVPYHLARYARVKGLGHLYWEMNADRFVPEDRWEVVTRLKARPELTEMDRLVNATVPRKALSMGTNKAIFNHVLLVSEREQYRRGIARLHPIGRLKLKKGFLDRFRDAAVERIVLALRPGGIEQLAHIDTNGKQAQKRAMQMRRGVLQRLAPGRVRRAHSEQLAAPFLEGMQTPPPSGVNGHQPHW